MNTAHVVPEMSSDEVPHELGAGSCWCQPVVDDVPPSARIVTHRRFVDGPARDPTDDRGWFVTTIGDSAMAEVIQ